jgi:hypothetical protein
MKTLLIVLATLTVACGPTIPTGNGVTACGNTVCQAGQYCYGDGLCVNGCTSDANCQDDSSCVDISPTTATGICENGTNDNDNNQPPVSGNCDSFADHAQECGLLASEATAIKLTCDQATATEQDAMVACDASESCGEFRACVGVECFSDVDCGGDHCVLRSEVSSVTDIPYTCK